MHPKGSFPYVWFYFKLLDVYKTSSIIHQLNSKSDTENARVNVPSGSKKDRGKTETGGQARAEAEPRPCPVHRADYFQTGSKSGNSDRIRNKTGSFFRNFRKFERGAKTGCQCHLTFLSVTIREISWSVLPYSFWKRQALAQGTLKGEASLYHWPPVWLFWISLFCK